MDNKTQQEKIDELATLQIASDNNKVNGKHSNLEFKILEIKKSEYEKLYPNEDMKEQIRQKILEIQNEKSVDHPVGITPRERERILLTLSELIKARNDSEQKLIQLEEQINNIETSKTNTNHPIKKHYFSDKTLQETMVIAIAGLSFIGISLFLTFATIQMFLAESSIEISVDIAQLIGGSLAGLGVALAGGAYAIKTLTATKE
ncbi:hypothetical protein Q7L38_20520 [Pseudomonas protegens]|uniref:hypothetical protein n=1 Tax=Pseudomonas protegens TaxID=380021 RepID=UPI0027471B71|nr:hypothetical protein [Pseudomonas protegens]MDP9534959.1 hypothetical protein [Pseudomonas protegens]